MGKEQGQVISTVAKAPAARREHSVECKRPRRRLTSEAAFFS